MSEIRERVADVNGVTLHYLEAGAADAPLVVLAHGFPESSWSWRHQLPALAASGYHAVAPDQRGYGRSSAPRDVGAYGIEALSGDLVALAAHLGHEQAVYVGHDWGALIVWDLARLHPERVSAVVGVSVPFVQWPAPPTQVLKTLYGDRFFYILYFQTVGPAEREMEADVRRTMAGVLWGASGEGYPGPPAEQPPMEGTGFLTMMPAPPSLPWSWLTEADLDRYVDAFEASGFFGPVSYYRNLDANYALVASLGPERVSMPSYFIGGTRDVVVAMDPTGVERMQSLLPNYRGHTIIAGAGHWTQQESPSEFNDALLGFLRSL
jgi:pimeloyl-ACP methyl ester carboxylesterase